MELNKIKERYFDGIESGLKISLMLAMPIGFVYLLSFTSSNGVPMPLSLSELPTLLLSVLGLGTVFVLFLFCFIFLPTIGRLGVFGKNFSNLFDVSIEKEKIDANDESYKSCIKRNKNIYVFTIALPLFVFLSLLIFVSIYGVLGYLLKFLVIISLFSPLLSIYLCVKKYFDEKIMEVYSVILMLIIICFYWMVFGLLLFFKGSGILEFNLSVISWMGLIAVVFFVMLFVLYFMIVPKPQKNSIPREVWIGLGLIIILMPPLISPVAERITKFALQVLRVGGNYPTIYVLNKKHIDNLPCQLVNQNFQTQSEILFVVLDIGKRIFVRLEDSSDALVYAIPKEAVITQVYWKRKITRSEAPEI